MSGGFLNGMILGLLLSGGVLGVISLSTPLPERTAPAPGLDAPGEPMPEPEPEAGTGTGAEVEDPSAPEPVSEPAPEPVPAPASEAPAAEPRPEAAAETAPRLPRADLPPMASAPVAPLAAAPDPASDPAPEAAVPAPMPDPATPEPPAMPGQIATAPSPSFSPTRDADAGGTAPRRLLVPAPQDAPSATDAAAPPPAPSAEAVDDLRPAQDPPRRLPQVPPAPGTITDAPPAPQTSPEAMADPAPEPDSTAPTGPNALRDNAESFEAPIGTPLLAVVLIDDPDTPLDPAALADLSFPVSFAIDPTRPDAAERAAAFRASGFEVVILAANAIPPGAAPADVEVALAAMIARLPQAVALMDDASGRIQGDRPVLDATIGALAATGHGFLAYPQGFNAAEQTARRLDVPGATFFRQIDDEEQRATVITRFLGRAAFAAAQTGSVIVAGRTRPDTVTGLFSWALANRAEGVSLAPVSAVLQNLPE
jgi:uncharacterized protein